VRPDHLLDVHRRKVAIDHRVGLHQRLGQREHRELEWQSARLEHAALHVIGEGAEVDVAAHQLAPGVADADHGTTSERLVREAARLHPRAVIEAVDVVAGEPPAAPSGTPAARPFLQGAAVVPSVTQHLDRPGSTKLT
jgi:hypothetical protein